METEESNRNFKTSSSNAFSNKHRRPISFRCSIVLNEQTLIVREISVNSVGNRDRSDASHRHVYARNKNPQIWVARNDPPHIHFECFEQNCGTFLTSVTELLKLNGCVQAYGETCGLSLCQTPSVVGFYIPAAVSVLQLSSPTISNTRTGNDFRRIRSAIHPSPFQPLSLRCELSSRPNSSAESRCTMNDDLRTGICDSAGAIVDVIYIFVFLGWYMHFEDRFRIDAIVVRISIRWNDKYKNDSILENTRFIMLLIRIIYFYQQPRCRTFFLLSLYYFNILISELLIEFYYSNCLTMSTCVNVNINHSGRNRI